jgi:hypothetical protein
MNALWNGLIAVVGFCVLAGIGLRYPRSRMFAMPLAGIWGVFWTLQTAQAMGMSNRIHHIVVVMIAATVTTVITVIIPYTIEDRRKKQAKADDAAGPSAPDAAR